MGLSYVREFATIDSKSGALSNDRIKLASPKVHLLLPYIMTASFDFIQDTVLIRKRQTRKHFRRRIFEAWAYKCGYCGKDVSNSPTLDHIVPRSSGGETCRSNLISCCLTCNASKASNDVWTWFRDQDFYCVRREAAIRFWISINIGRQVVHDLAHFTGHVHRRL